MMPPLWRLMAAFRLGGLIVGALLWSAASTTASTVVVLLFPDSAVIAADAKSVRIEGGTRVVCKIVDAGNRTLFAATGTGVFDEPPFNPYELARTVAVQSSVAADAALRYGERAKPVLATIWRKSRERFRALMRDATHFGPQDYVFVVAKSEGITASSGAFVEAADGSLRLDLTHKKISAADKFLFFSMGFVSSIPPVEDVYELVRIHGMQAALERIILQQATQTPEAVGGPVTVVRLVPGKRAEWLQRGAC